MVSRALTLPYQRIWEDSLTIFWRDWLDLRGRVWQVVASGLVAPLIYIVAFGVGLGGSLRAEALAEVAGSTAAGSYLRFILPGMVALSAMTISFAGTTFSICGSRLFTKSFEELLLLPVHPLSLHLGKVLAGIARGLLTALGVLAVGVLGTGAWGLLHPLSLLVLLLDCAVFAGIGVIAGLKVPSLESVGVLTNFLITPMSFLGPPFSIRPVADLPAGAGLLPAPFLRQHWHAGSRLPAACGVSLVHGGSFGRLGGNPGFVGAYLFSHQQD
jgi:ABC-2 type transport system permease protein